jgi:hypothetical protein
MAGKSRFVDMTGWYMPEHGVPESRLTVIGFDKEYISPNGNKRRYWKCKCECGNISSVREDSIRNGHVSSCGCLKTDKAKEKRSHNTFIDKGKYLEGYDNQGRCFLISKEDYDKVKEYYWYKRGNYWYAMLYDGKKEELSMHRFICPPPSKEFVPDHYNRNTSDNRRENLNLRTLRENMINSKRASNNTSGFIGVFYNNAINKYQSYINFEGDKKTSVVGTFETKEEAVFCRLCYEKRYYGIGAPQRDLFEKYNITEEIAKEYCDKIKYVQSNNTSGITGVVKTSLNRWEAVITINHNTTKLGAFIDKEQAIVARLVAEMNLLGEKAPQKYLFEKYGITEDFAKNYVKPFTGLRRGNKTGAVGVSKKKNKEKWEAYIHINNNNNKGRKKNLGSFNSLDEAIKTRLKAELEFYGKDNAPQKHLFKQYGIE